MRASQPSRPLDREAGAGPPVNGSPPPRPAGRREARTGWLAGRTPDPAARRDRRRGRLVLRTEAPAGARPGGRRHRLVVLLATALGGAALASAGLAAPAGAVVNGTRTPIATAPFAVQLAAGGDTFCSGSLIRPRVVLTAAHCLAGTRRVRVFVGRQDTQGTDGAEIKALSSTYDKRFVGRRNTTSAGIAVSSDVGLLELSRDVTEVLPVALGGPEHASLLQAGSPLTVTGWGVVGSNDAARDSSASRTLRSATAPVRSAAFCRGRLGASTRGIVCVGRLKRPVPGACYGDSGGPLYASTPTGAVQVGVVSSGPVASCGRDTTFYARVQSGPARSWIDRHLTAEGRLRGGRALK